MPSDALQATAMASLVVMGVSGCGKSLVGLAVAARLGLPLIEGDDFHSGRNRVLMRQGVPLSDLHRADWLDQLGAQLARHPGGAVLTCSALKAAYRERLRSAAPGLRFAWLDLERRSAEARVGQRSAHFFPAGLVATQFEALEPPTNEPGVLRLDAMRPVEQITERIVSWMTHGAASRAQQDRVR